MSSEEGIALMCLAEALLRVPDHETIDALIEDKIAPSQWGSHLGQSHSSMINASTWALYMTGKVLKEDENSSIFSTLRGAVKRLGEPVIRQAVTRAMKEMGKQFVLGETIEAAMKRAKEEEDKGYTYSYDMLGEAARTDADAKAYHMAYADAITDIAKAARSNDIRKNAGISIKLSALHPRYETLKKQRVMEELVPRARSLCVLAKSAGIGLNIDAEEAARLEISLDVIEALLTDETLRGWDGFGVVVQAYSKRAPHVLDWLYQLANDNDRKIMVRLVKGAYWDTEIKLSQIEGHDGFPVFTRKPSTDVSYLCCAEKLLGMTDRIYPQFATHNAHTVAAVLELANDPNLYEFQRLHGMGEALHDTVLRHQKTQCRIYAPVGAHEDLLAYLVRRLLENGANSSFVNQIVDPDVPAFEVVADPFGAVNGYIETAENPRTVAPKDLFAPERPNSVGYDILDPEVIEDLSKGIGAFANHSWNMSDGVDIMNPTTTKPIGSIAFMSPGEASDCANRVVNWDAAPKTRGDILAKAADLYEENAIEIFALLQKEAGKTLLDCVGELREAVDFLRYYGKQCQAITEDALGIFTCISPWNFPLAIFSGQVSAALATGNGVLAKSAETTPLIAEFAIQLLHQAGVPKDVLIHVPGLGATVGSVLTSHPRVNGVCFTGSTGTAQIINRSMAQNLAPTAPLIAETGGLNAMLVDSTALPEQAVRDIVASAFQSAGQRCSALRVLYLQADIAENLKTMLFGALDELLVGDPAVFSTDIGPVIDEKAQSAINAHIETARSEGRLLKQLAIPQSGHFVAPSVIQVSSIADLETEVFGPVLHIATYEADEIDQVIDAINDTGFGLTFGLHSRIDDRVQQVTERVEAGNIYINRNQIGAVVGSQPFGGEGLSGTGPKAGGPLYLRRFLSIDCELVCNEPDSVASIEQISAEFEAQPKTEAAGNRQSLPGPTGESNVYSVAARDYVLCLGPGLDLANAQVAKARAHGCRAIAAPNLKPEILAQLPKLGAVVFFAQDSIEHRRALASREGAIVPLLCDAGFAQWLTYERHLCIDTTAAGGNAALLSDD